MRTHPDTPRHRQTARSLFVFNEGELVDLEIRDLALGGAGVARSDGFVFLVRGALPGETVRARITARKPNYAEAEVIESLSRSPLAVTPRCEFFSVCGGCQLMNMAYEHQLDAKERQVIQAMERIGGVSDFTLHRIIRSPDIYHYRNKLELAFSEGRSRLELGFHRAGEDGTVVDIPSCLIGSPRMDAASRAARSLLDELGYRPAWDRRDDPRAILRHLVLREGRRSGEMLVELITLEGEMPDERAFALRMMGLPQTAGVIRSTVARRPPNGDGLPEGDGEEAAPEPLARAARRERAGRSSDRSGGGSRTERLLAGRPVFRERLGEFTYEVSASSFFQVNSDQAEVLYARARDMALRGRESVLDLYCGVGGLTLFLSRRARRVTGVDSSVASVANAGANLRINGIENVRFIRADARRLVRGLAEAGKSYDVVTINPPRSGVHADLVQLLPRLRPQRIVYISCNPATLARDVAGFAAGGYRPVEVQPVDMFPHSCHVETIARLEREA